MLFEVLWHWRDSDCGLLENDTT